MFGELIPVGGGDTIPLLKKELRVGRREKCDIVLRFANVSAEHCLLTVEQGYWFVRDTNSRNGVKVNGVRVVADARKRLDPGDVLSVAKHEYEIQYTPVDLGAIGPPPMDDEPETIPTRSLLERAGLERRKDSDGRRYDVTDDRPGQLPKRGKDRLV